MILFDTETTGLVGPQGMALDKQPKIIEFCGVQLDDKTLVETGVLNFMVNPRVSLSADIVRITGICDADLKDKEPFESHYDSLVEFFLGQRMVVAHNLEFDANLLKFELTRIGKEFRFPWPPKRLCTVEASFAIKNRRMKLGDLYELATGGKIQGAHRAINDVRATAECLRWLVAQKRVKL